MLPPGTGNTARARVVLYGRWEEPEDGYMGWSIQPV